MISSREFYSKWVDAFKKNESSIIDKWCDNKSYTIAIKKLCDEISEDLGLSTFHEYYSSDIIFFKEGGAERFGIGGVYIINPEIVFEHENQCNSLKDEVAHNMIINSNLYVIVSYYRPDKQDLNKKYMDGILDFMRKSNKSDELSRKENFLIILGDTYEYRTQDYWLGLVYKGDHWLKI